MVAFSTFWTQLPIFCQVRRRLRRGARVTIELGESEERVSESEEESVTIAGEEETYGSLLSGLSRFSSLRLPKPNHCEDPKKIWP